MFFCVSCIPNTFCTTIFSSNFRRFKEKNYNKIKISIENSGTKLDCYATNSQKHIFAPHVVNCVHPVYYENNRMQIILKLLILADDIVFKIYFAIIAVTNSMFYLLSCNFTIDIILMFLIYPE